jgi:hypothetical protein
MNLQCLEKTLCDRLAVNGLQHCGDEGGFSIQIIRDKTCICEGASNAILKFSMRSRFSLSAGPFSTDFSIKFNLKFITLMTCGHVIDNGFKYMAYLSVILRIMNVNNIKSDFDQRRITL